MKKLWSWYVKAIPNSHVRNMVLGFILAFIVFNIIKLL